MKKERIGGCDEGACTARTGSSRPGDPAAEILAPLLAGARARGIADAYEMMGVERCCSGIRPRLARQRAGEPPLAGCCEHRHANTWSGPQSRNNARSKSLIGRWLAGEGEAATVLQSAVSGRRISLRVVDVPEVQGESVQLLRQSSVCRRPERVLPD